MLIISAYYLTPLFALCFVIVVRLVLSSEEWRYELQMSHERRLRNKPLRSLAFTAFLIFCYYTLINNSYTTSAHSSTYNTIQEFFVGHHYRFIVLLVFLQYRIFEGIQRIIVMLCGFFKVSMTKTTEEQKQSNQQEKDKLSLRKTIFKK